MKVETLIRRLEALDPDKEIKVWSLDRSFKTIAIRDIQVIEPVFDMTTNQLTHYTISINGEKDV